VISWIHSSGQVIKVALGAWTAIRSNVKPWKGPGLRKKLSERHHVVRLVQLAITGAIAPINHPDVTLILIGIVGLGVVLDGGPRVGDLVGGWVGNVALGRLALGIGLGLALGHSLMATVSAGTATGRRRANAVLIATPVSVHI
jgi:hypothetical protein